MSILIRHARLVLPGGQVMAKGDVLVEGERIAGVGPAIQTMRAADRVIDAGGRVLMPGFVDCHTHACFAGDRLDEWEMKRRGATYLEILAAGGGIMSTVRAVRKATQQELAEGLARRLEIMLREGTTTVEIKSGYGLTTADELKMLRAIDDAARGWAGTVVKTALIGHAVDPDVADFFERTIHETLDALHAEFPGIAVDVFCEKGAWPLEESSRLLARAVELGHPVRAHVDQFTALGMTARAVAMKARSVDHLEASTDADLAVIAGSWRGGEAGSSRGTFGVGLPVCGFHVDGRYANLRKLIDLGGRVAVATNFNPGSAPSSSMPLAMGLAVRHCGLGIGEALAAGTEGGAGVLGLEDRGVIRAGARADLVLLRHRDERMLAYEVGGNPVELVVCAGKVCAEQVSVSE